MCYMKTQNASASLLFNSDGVIFMFSTDVDISYNQFSNAKDVQKLQLFSYHLVTVQRKPQRRL